RSQPIRTSDQPPSVPAAAPSPRPPAARTVVTPHPYGGALPRRNAIAVDLPRCRSLRYPDGAPTGRGPPVQWTWRGAARPRTTSAGLLGKVEGGMGGFRALRAVSTAALHVPVGCSARRGAEVSSTHHNFHHALAFAG